MSHDTAPLPQPDTPTDRQTLAVTLAQTHPVAGDLRGNTDQVCAAFAHADEHTADMVVVPPLALTGPVGGMDRLSSFVRDAHDHARLLRTQAAHSTQSGPARMVLLAAQYPQPPVVRHGEQEHRVRSGAPLPLPLDGVRVSMVSLPQALTHSTMAAYAAREHPQVLVVAAADGYRVGLPTGRVAAMARLAAQTGAAVVYVNLAGGADDVVYGGGSFVVTPTGDLPFLAPLFTAEIATVTVPVPGPAPEGGWNQRAAIDTALATTQARWGDTDAQTWAALTVGLRDYVGDNGFTDAVLGLSGGIDSAVVAALAVDALGPAHVHGVGMPGPYSSPGSVTAARTLAENLGIGFDLAPITDVYAAEVAALGALRDGPGAAAADQNIQARLRSVHLFTIANARNALVLNTCNKSEDAVGYATYGGDSMGAYAPLVDADKALVYRLAAWRNTQPGGPVIPETSITKPPSAELAPGQRDDDTLPPYDVLDALVAAYTEGRTGTQMVHLLTSEHALSEAEAVRWTEWVSVMVGRSEWKRRQSPPGPALSEYPFGRLGLPVTNRYLPRIDST